MYEYLGRKSGKSLHLQKKKRDLPAFEFDIRCVCELKLEIFFWEKKRIMID